MTMTTEDFELVKIFLIITALGVMGWWIKKLTKE
jgi:hypothetical protein